MLYFFHSFHFLLQEDQLITQLTKLIWQPRAHNYTVFYCQQALGLFQPLMGHLEFF